MSDTNGKVTVIASVPNRNKLCCIVGAIDFVEVQDSSAKSNFHWQVMKCRLIIHLIPEVIASPLFDTDGSMYIITSTAFFETGKLQETLRKLNILFGDSQTVTFDAYKACLRYTIQCKLAPRWNKVGQYLIQGKEFFNSMENLEAIKYDIIMNDENTQLQLQALEVKIPFIKLENFYLFYSSMAEFLADPNGHIDLTQYGSHWVHVLPSMKRGRVISVSKKIPPNCPFKDFEQLRRHWKNMYGYMFPKDKEEILYYQVKFPIPKSPYLTYPNLCLAAKPVETYTCCHAELITKQFLSDIIQYLPTICNEKLDIHKYIPQQTQPSALLMRTPEKNFHTATRLSLPRHQLFTTDPEFAIPGSLQLEFSGNYIGQLKDETQKLNTSPLTPTKYLSKIHEIHCPGVITNNYGKCANSTKIGTNQTDIVNYHSNDDLTSTPSSSHQNRNSDLNPVNVREGEQTISEHFKWQRTSPRSIAKKSDMSLKQKLLNAKNTKSSNTSFSFDVEKMARKHTLGLATCQVLRDWLTRHSIPFIKNSRKEELIHKVMTNIKNTKG